MADLTQAADAKEKASTRLSSKPAVVKGFYESYSKHYGVEGAPRYAKPTPFVQTQYIAVNPAGMDNWFQSIHSTLVRVIYPDNFYSAAQFVTAAQFSAYLQYITLSRVMYVRTGYDTSFYADAIGYENNSQIPECIRLALSGIGPVSVQNGMVTYCPIPPPLDVRTRIIDGTTAQSRQRSTYLINAALERGYIRTGTLPLDISGNRWWLMGVANAVAGAAANAVVRTAVVTGSFWESSAEEIALAAVVQRGFDGITNVGDRAPWTSLVTGVDVLREDLTLLS